MPYSLSHIRDLAINAAAGAEEATIKLPGDAPAAIFDNVSVWMTGVERGELYEIDAGLASKCHQTRGGSAAQSGDLRQADICRLSRGHTHFGHRHGSWDCLVSPLLKFSLYEIYLDEAQTERELGMLSTPRLMTILMLAGETLLLNGEATPAETRVDLALVLAVDVSFSMEPDEQDLQRHGFVEAFQSSEVHQAIRDGVLGRIAVLYVEWSGESDQEIIVPWTVIEQPADGLAFAERLLRGPLHSIGSTSISGGIDFGVRQLRQSGLQADRQVIDVSGDGANGSGRTVTLARDEALARGITINGLPIMLKWPDGTWDIEDLDLYFRDCVIGGPGAFLVPVREKRHFIEAIRAKIMQEITDQSPPRSLVQPAQAVSSTNCLAGEQRRHQPPAR